VGDGQVLPFPGTAAAEAAHDDSTDHVGVDELANGLALIAAEAHPNVFERALLRTECRQHQLIGKLGRFFGDVEQFQGVLQTRQPTERRLFFALDFNGWHQASQQLQQVGHDASVADLETTLLNFFPSFVYDGAVK
jgi:hypothetical protein